MKYFNPNGKQEEFINEIASDQVFVGVFSAANGVGKTALMANILGHMVFGHESTNNPFFNYPMFKDWPYPKRARIASSKKNIEEIGAIQTEIKQWWPKGEYQTRRLGKTYDSEYRTANGWVTDIMSYDQEVKQFESATLGVMIFDEPPPLSIFYACIARMRKGGIIMIFMTPLDEGGVLLEELNERSEIELDDKPMGKVKIIYADIEANCKQHGKRGQLEHAHIEQMMAHMDPEEKEARLQGKPSHLIGRIYPTFVKDEPYVVDDFDVFSEMPGGVIINVIDPHDAIPFAMSWMYLDKTGQLWIYDEYPFDDLDKIKQTSLTYPDYSRIIREREGRYQADIRWIDPFFGNKRFANDGKTPKEELSDLGLDYEDGDTSGIDTGHMKVREFLKYDRLKEVSSLNHPRLHILKKCRNHWRSMINYKRKIKKDGEVKDKIVIEETFKHFCDNIRHACMKIEDARHSQKDKMIKDTSNMIAPGGGGW